MGLTNLLNLEIQFFTQNRTNVPKHITVQSDVQKFFTIFDPTWGGGKLLFGVEDKIQEQIAIFQTLSDLKDNSFAKVSASGIFISTNNRLCLPMSMKMGKALHLNFL